MNLILIGSSNNAALYQAMIVKYFMFYGFVFPVITDLPVKSHVIFSHLCGESEFQGGSLVSGKKKGNVVLTFFLFEMFRERWILVNFNFLFFFQSNLQCPNFNR